MHLHIHYIFARPKIYTKNFVKKTIFLHKKTFFFETKKKIGEISIIYLVKCETKKICQKLKFLKNFTFFSLSAPVNITLITFKCIFISEKIFKNKLLKKLYLFLFSEISRARKFQVFNDIFCRFLRYFLQVFNDICCKFLRYFLQVFTIFFAGF